MEKKEYPSTNDPALLIKELTEFFNLEGLDVNSRPEGAGVVLMANHPSSWRDHLGLKRSLTVKITPAASGTVVEIGNQKWLNKAAPGLVGLALASVGIGLIPLGTAAYGAHAQYRLTTEAWNIVERHMSKGFCPRVTA
jgi:hypothetical protein